MLTRKFEDCAIPYRLIEKMGDSIQALDEERKKITVHARHLRKAQELPDSSTKREPSGESVVGLNLQESCRSEPTKVQRYITIN